MKVLVLFSGTKSIEKALDRLEKDVEYRSVDIDDHFSPTYNVDILKFDYKDILSKWTPDYIHASPICKEFSMLKNNPKFNRNLNLGISLVEKALEIMEYVKHINPELKWTMENPVGLMRKLDIMKPYKRTTTSYCKYGFGYRKNTDFWYYGFDLTLNSRCSSKNKCESMIKDEEKGTYYHRTEIAYKPRHKHSITDMMELMSLKEKGEYTGYNGQYYRYRIPDKLCDEIVGEIWMLKMKNQLNLKR